MQSYNEGACDNISNEEQTKLLDLLSNIYDIISTKKDETLTTELASIYLNVTRLTLNNYTKQGKLHPKKQLGGVLQYNKKELKNLIKSKRYESK